MKSLILISLVLLVSFSTSPGQVPTERELKEMCLAIHNQNKELWQAVGRKDSIITEQRTLLESQNKRIASYERDSVSFSTERSAYRERSAAQDVIITQQRRVIRKGKVEKVLIIVGAVLLTITYSITR
jgi:glucan phosphorylase